MNKVETLVREIRALFPTEPVPEIPEYPLGVAEDYDIRMSFRGRRWNEIAPASLSGCFGCLVHLEPNECAYYLPAFMVAGLEDSENDASLWAAYYLARRGPEAKSVYSEGQRRCVEEFLRWATEYLEDPQTYKALARWRRTSGAWTIVRPRWACGGRSVPRSAEWHREPLTFDFTREGVDAEVAGCLREIEEAFGADWDMPEVTEYDLTYSTSDTAEFVGRTWQEVAQTYVGSGFGFFCLREEWLLYMLPALMTAILPESWQHFEYEAVTKLARKAQAEEFWLTGKLSSAQFWAIRRFRIASCCLRLYEYWS